MNTKIKFRPELELMKDTHISPVRASYGCLSWEIEEKMTARSGECILISISQETNA